MTPQESRVYAGKNGAISGTASAISAAAGLVTLQNGGNAADAATAVAMTGITTQFGSVVSYAGIMSMLYHEAKTGKRSEEHTSEIQSLMRISYAVFRLKTQNKMKTKSKEHKHL